MTDTTTKAKAETKLEAVTMTDGRIVDFVGKRKLLKQSFVADGVVSIRLDFRNGETRTFKIPSELLLKFAAHGAEQKLGDEIAGLDDIEDAVMAIDELTERLNKGEWGVKREGNGMAGTSILARALVEVMGKPMDAIKTFLGTKTQAEKVALRNNPRVKPVVERLEAEKASKSKGASIDTDALLAGLEDNAKPDTTGDEPQEATEA
jgi:hypothetical protein